MKEYKKLCQINLESWLFLSRFFYNIGAFKMNKKLFAIIPSLLALFLNSNVCSAMTLNLEQSIQLALENNQTIEQTIEDRIRAKWGLSEARRNSGVTFSWSVSAMRIGGKAYESARRNHERYGTPAYKSEFSNSFNVSMPLYTGGNLEGSIESARYGLNASDLLVESSMQQIRYQTTEAYYQVLQCLALVNVRQEAVNTLQEHLNKVTIQYEEGITAKSDVLSSQVRLASEQQSLVTAENNYYKSTATLKNIIGFPQEGDLEIDDNLTYEKYDLSLKYCTDYALENRPDYLAAQYAVKSAEAEVKSTRSGTLPQVSATVGRSMSSEGLNFKEDHSGEWSAGIRAQWNIFDNGITSSKVEQSKSALRKAKSTEKKAKEDILLEVNAAFLDLKAAETNIKTTQSAIAIAKEDYEIAQLRYTEGIDTNLAVMDAQEKLTEAQNNYYNSLYTYYISKSQLDKAIGVPLNIDVQLYTQAEQEGKTSDQALEVAKLEKQNTLVDKPETK